MGTGLDTMDLKTILLDAVKYPGEDWMKVILLGFLSLISFIGILTQLNLFTLLCLIVLPLPVGYLFKIIKSSFKGSDKLPGFDEWISMYLDGLKVILTLIIYAIPVFVVFLIFNPTQIFYLDMANFSLLYLGSSILGSVTQLAIFILIGFVEYIGIANMALYDGEIRAAFRFREIIKRISMIGFRMYVVSYITILVLGGIVALISSAAAMVVVGMVIIPLLIAPYYMILNVRFCALIFASSEA